MAKLTMWYGGTLEANPSRSAHTNTLDDGGTLDANPIRRYVGGSAHTFTLDEEEFTVDTFKSKIQELGFPRYKLRYVPSIENLPTEIYQVDKMRDFKHLRNTTLSTGHMNIFIEDKSKRPKRNEPQVERPSSSSNQEQVGSKQQLLLTMGPEGQSSTICTPNPISGEDDDQSNTKDDSKADNEREQVPNDADNIPPPPVTIRYLSVNCDVARYTKLVHKLSSGQREWVKDMGFRHLLKIKITHIEPSFSVWVTSLFDTHTKTLTIRNNITVPIDDEMVGWVLGIPAGPTLFHPEESSTKQFKEWKMNYKQDTTKFGAIKESVVYKMVLSEKSNKKRFQRHFLLYTLGILLCPTQKHEWISALHVYMLGNASKAYKYNWGKYVLDWLVKYRIKLDTGIEGLGGYTLLLLIIYLDRIAHGRNVQWNTKSSRVRYWDQPDVVSALNTDTNNNGVYGFAQAVENVVYGEEFPTK